MLVHYFAHLVIGVTQVACNSQLSCAPHDFVPNFEWVVPSFFLLLIFYRILKEETLQIEVLHLLQANFGGQVARAQINGEHQSSGCYLGRLEREEAL